MSSNSYKFCFYHCIMHLHKLIHHQKYGQQCGHNNFPWCPLNYPTTHQNKRNIFPEKGASLGLGHVTFKILGIPSHISLKPLKLETHLYNLEILSRVYVPNCDNCEVKQTTIITQICTGLVKFCKVTDFQYKYCVEFYITLGTS